MRPTVPGTGRSLGVGGGDFEAEPASLAVVERQDSRSLASEFERVMLLAEFAVTSSSMSASMMSLGVSLIRGVCPTVPRVGRM